MNMSVKIIKNVNLRDILWLSVLWRRFWHRRRATVSFDRIVQIWNVLRGNLDSVKGRGRVDAACGNMACGATASSGRGYIVVIAYDMVIGWGRGRRRIIHSNAIHHGCVMIKTSQNIFYRLFRKRRKGML